MSLSRFTESNVKDAAHDWLAGLGLVASHSTLASIRQVMMVIRVGRWTPIR